MSENSPAKNAKAATKSTFANRKRFIIPGKEPKAVPIVGSAHSPNSQIAILDDPIFEDLTLPNPEDITTASAIIQVLRSLKARRDAFDAGSRDSLYVELTTCYMLAAKLMSSQHLWNRYAFELGLPRRKHTPENVLRGVLKQYTNSASHYTQALVGSLKAQLEPTTLLEKLRRKKNGGVDGLKNERPETPKRNKAAKELKPKTVNKSDEFSVSLSKGEKQNIALVAGDTDCRYKVTITRTIVARPKPTMKLPGRRK